MSSAITIRRAVAAAAVCAAVLSVGAAQANDTAIFRDALKPNGHERTKSEKFADGQRCGASGPAHTIRATMPVFESCMRAKGWVLDHYTQDPKTRVGPAKSVSTYIDPDTGMSCQNYGGVAVCGPPQGTVHYRDEEGLNCTRTGIVSVCTSF